MHMQFVTDHCVAIPICPPQLHSRGGTDMIASISISIPADWCEYLQPQSACPGSL